MSTDPGSTFLPWLRSGISAALTPDGHNRPDASVSLTVSQTLDDGATTPFTVPVTLRMLGPGDVTGIAPDEIAQVFPNPGSSGVVSTIFPSVTFRRPELPWLFSPLAETASTHQLPPWCCLITVRVQPGVTLDTSAGLLTIESPAVPAQELPDLTESYAWAHVQCSAGNLTASTPAQADSALTNSTATVSRLLSPRVLQPDTSYICAVVPTFAAGLSAGIGGDPDPDAAVVPAWDLSDPPPSITLPVYSSFGFTTGEGGDFQSLAHLLLHPPQISDVAGSGLGERALALPAPLPGGASQPAAETSFIKLRNATSGTIEVHIDALLGGATYTRTGDYVSDFSPGDASNGTWQLLGSQNGAPLLGFIKLQQLGGATIEVHIDALSGDGRTYTRIGNYISDFFPPDATNGTWQLFGSQNGAPLLGFIKTHNTTSGTIEVHIDALSGDGRTYKRIGDYTSDFSPGDATNGTWQLFGYQNGAPLLGFIKTQNTTSGTIEVQLDALSSGGTYTRIGNYISDFFPPDATNGTWQLFGYQNGAPLLGFIKTQSPTSGTIEVHIDALSSDGRTYTRTGDCTSDFFPPDATNGTWQLLAVSPVPLPAVLVGTGTAQPQPPPPPVTAWMKAELTPAPGLPQLRPPLYGAAQGGIRPADLAGPRGFSALAQWWTRLNTDPGLRVLAALGSAVITADRDELVTEAWSQAGDAAAVNALLNRAQAARMVADRQVQRHLAPQTDLVTLLKLIGPSADRVQITVTRQAPNTATGPASNTATTTVSNILRQVGDPALTAVASSAHRQISRPNTPAARALPPPPPRTVPITAPALLALFNAQSTVPTRVVNERLSQPAQALAATRPDPLRSLAPQISFPTPMVVPLAQLAPDAILPGAANIPPNTALVLQTNPEAIAAYLIGVNTAVGQLLAWQGVPADQRATFCQQFWQPTLGGTAQPDLNPPIAKWLTTDGLDTHVATADLVLAVRADLLRRFPNTAVYAVKAASATSPADMTDPSNYIQPIFRATLPPDIQIFGFPIPAGSLAYFMVFQEQLSEPRFGSDSLPPRATPGGGAPNYWTVAQVAPARPDAAAVAVAAWMPPVVVALGAGSLIPPAGPAA
jgi:hypothetical protein